MHTTVWQEEMPATIAAISAAQFALLKANMGLHGERYAAPGYGDRVRVIDAAVLELTKGKWLYNRATGECADYAARTSSAADLIEAREHLRAAVELADASYAPAATALARAKEVLARVETRGTEIPHYDDVPVVPGICPIVILSGSSRQMGAQYVRQCVEIFGRFVFEHLAAREISGPTLQILRSWEQQMARHTPELLEMAQGMSVAARDLGIALSYEHAVSIWTDLLPPSHEPMPIGVLDAEGGALGGYFGRARVPAGDVAEAGTCSGVAAWGAATADRRACFASSTDHDCTFQVTIVAYPDEGRAFVYTPFSINGAIPGLGRFGLAGHPGFNDAGVTYVHHGGYESCAEPKEHWGYGVPRGATTMHILRYAASAREALQMELGFPVGDAGRILGSASGFYVDDSYGYVLEDRTPGQPVYREHTSGRSGEQHDFLYATNNLLSPQLGHAFCPPPAGYDFAPDAGWYTLKPRTGRDAHAGRLTRQLCTASSYARNRYLYGRLVAQAGAMDEQSLLDLFRVGPQFRVAQWQSEGERKPSGELVEASVGGRHNAFVAYGSAASRRYSGAIGMVAPRDSSTNGPAHGFVYFDETGAFWDIHLLESSSALVGDSRDTARREIERATRLLAERGHLADVPSLNAFLHRAVTELNRGNATLAHASELPPDQALSAEASACRAFTRAQVRARQVISALQTQDPDIHVQKHP